MLASVSWLGILVLWLAPPAADRASPGWSLWQQAQAALYDGQADRAIELYQQSLAADPNLTRNYLGLAAAWLDKGDDARACLHLTLYVAAHPEHFSVRVQYAELLRRLKRLKEASDEFERFVADVQDCQEAAEEHLLHCHSRLMELAADRADDYDEHLHRGIGLYLLAVQHSDQLGEGESSEGLLCKAAAELTLARQERPDEARPLWYLHEVWSRLAQSQPAARSLRAAAAVAPFSYLTPAEQRGLYLACRQFGRATPAR
jgi:hypothetical protein